MSFLGWLPRRAWIAASCTLLLSCHTAGIRRAYMSLDSGGNRRVYGDNAVFFQDDNEVNSIAEVVSGRPDVEVGCRWTLPPSTTGQKFKVEGEEVRNLPGPPRSDHDFVILKYPGKGENILSVCTLRKQVTGSATDPADTPWGLNGFGVVEWYIDGEYQESTGFELRGSEKRYIEDIRP